MKNSTALVGMWANFAMSYQSDVDTTFYALRSTTDSPTHSEIARRMITVPEDEIGKLSQRMSQLESLMAVPTTSNSSFAST